MEDAADKEYFFKIFRPISDYIHIECLAPYHKDIDYKKLKKEFTRCVRGNSIENIKICSQPFYTLLINTDGAVFPCCNLPHPLSLGNIGTMSIQQIWESICRHNFLREILKGKKEKFSACQECELFKFIYQPEDELDQYREELLKKFDF